MDSVENAKLGPTSGSEPESLDWCCSVVTVSISGRPTGHGCHESRVVNKDHLLIAAIQKPAPTGK